ncbi:KN motif and ankyrin repeat domain-containing protein 1-like [Salarias fasciatus]|uniref:KN motif and ankyrin repeat domain-containing protein 1-like n=1 Tax=Salarias fasciatus TaxID=181472 RepID=UPI001176717B|nr:KN motif and ankyrin repeat domain-containing protein 1-like [Salarias fasciatus]
MAHGSYIMRNLSGQTTEDCVPNFGGIDFSYLPDVDHLKCADGFQNCATIKRLSLRRRPRVAANNAEKSQSGMSSSQWYSAESLSSVSDDTRLLGMSSTARGRPPLPPPHTNLLENKPSRTEVQPTAQVVSELKPQPAARSLASQRQSPVMENTCAETSKQSTQEATGQPPQPFPRRRLASFGGVSSPGSLSPFTGLGAYNHNNNGNKPAGTGSDMHLYLSSRGSTGCLRLSPQSSGRSTPVASPGPTHLQHVRDQMVVALQRLKELEEQVKLIPVLQVKISVLQEEKRQMASQLRNQSGNDCSNEMVWKRACGAEGSETEDENDDADFRQLTEEMRAWERAMKGGHLVAMHGKNQCPNSDKAVKSVAVGMDKEMCEPLKENKYVNTDQAEMRSIATEVSEVNLGIHSDQETELELQQLINAALKERICYLEAELKESALQTELIRLKLELQAAGARNRVDKACLARPSTASVGTEAGPHTTSQGVGHHTELRDACTGEATELRTVGVSCEPAVTSVSTGPDVPMNRWEVRERVETRDKAAGSRVFTSTQAVGTEVRVCDAGSNTEEPVKQLMPQKEKSKGHTVACGDCSVNVIISEAKEMTSQGTSTDPVRGVDLGIMASPQTASQRTNTSSSSVSRFTNTSHAFCADSSTNTLLSTQDKHTNTTHTLTRTVSVGSGVEGIRCATETRSVGVGANLGESISKQTPETAMKVTRDTGVGFTNINDNFLVGLKTRNMASGPSHLPDPIKTRSVGVGEGRIRELSALSSAPDQKTQKTTQLQWDQELNHYIEKMQWLLREHGDLLTEDRTDGSSSPLACSKAATQEEAEIHQLNAQPADIQASSPLPLDSPQCDKLSPGHCQQAGNESEVKRMIKMLEEQASSALQDRSNYAGKPRTVVKKQNGDQSCSSNRKNLKFLKVTTGLDPVSSYEQEEVKIRGSKAQRETSQDGIQARKGKDGSHKRFKGSVKLYTQQRYKLTERMFFACQALKMHLSDDNTLSNRELQDCLHTLQQEWFSVSSHKSASPDTVEDYLCTFRAISPSVLQHVANMADSNGNTALHYSVSHSNFGVVKKLLDAEVCNVNQQNAAGYTPIMLAALAAVENPENMRVVEQLLSKGDVNAKASQAGQTALMLAVSHGRMDMVRALLTQGAEVNVPDDEGSTALMCACEHGHADIVKLLLAQPQCDAALTDSDGSTALSIALEAGHHDIAVLLYAHANFSRGQTGAAVSRQSGKLHSTGGRDMNE